MNPMDWYPNGRSMAPANALLGMVPPMAHVGLVARGAPVPAAHHHHHPMLTTMAATNPAWGRAPGLVAPPQRYVGPPPIHHHMATPAPVTPTAAAPGPPAAEEMADDGWCGVCGSAHSEEGDALIFCDGKCGGAVHQACYGIDVLPAEDEEWKCEPCRAASDSPKCYICHLGRTDESSAPSAARSGEASNDAPADGKNTSETWAPAMKRATRRNRLELLTSAADDTGDDAGLWAHVCCALSIPEAGFYDERRLNHVLVGQLSDERTQLKCDLCGERGQSVQCARKKCATAFHPICVLRELQGPEAWRTLDAPDESVAEKLTARVRGFGDVLCARHCGKRASTSGPKRRGGRQIPTAAPEEEKSEYELEREARIARNADFLASLGLGGGPGGGPLGAAPEAQQQQKKRGKRIKSDDAETNGEGAAVERRRSPRVKEVKKYTELGIHRSPEEIEAEREEKESRRLAKVLLIAERAAANATADDARHALRLAWKRDYEARQALAMQQRELMQREMERQDMLLEMERLAQERERRKRDEERRLEREARDREILLQKAAREEAARQRDLNRLRAEGLAVARERHKRILKLQQEQQRGVITPLLACAQQRPPHYLAPPPDAVANAQTIELLLRPRDSNDQANGGSSNEGGLFGGHHHHHHHDAPPPQEQQEQQQQEQQQRPVVGQLPPCSMCGSSEDNMDTPQGAFLKTIFLAPPTRSKPEGALIRAHQRCAELSPEVFVDENGAHHGVVAAAKRGRQLSCFSCNRRGATIGCQAEGCAKAYHAACAVATRWRFRQARRFWCHEHRAATPEGALADCDVEDSTPLSGSRLLGAASGTWCPACEAFDPLSRDPYINCETCRLWWHPHCAGLSLAEQRAMLTPENNLAWECPSCAEAREEEAQVQRHCLCNEPCVDNERMVQCDSCSMWLHPRCVSMSDTAYQALVENPAEKYYCPRCASRGIICLCRRPHDPDVWTLACILCAERFHPPCVGIITDQEAAHYADHSTGANFVCPNCVERDRLEKLERARQKRMQRMAAEAEKQQLLDAGGEPDPASMPEGAQQQQQPHHLPSLVAAPAPGDAAAGSSTTPTLNDASVPKHTVAPNANAGVPRKRKRATEHRSIGVRLRLEAKVLGEALVATMATSSKAPSPVLASALAAATSPPTSPPAAPLAQPAPPIPAMMPTEAPAPRKKKGHPARVAAAALLSMLPAGEEPGDSAAPDDPSKQPAGQKDGASSDHPPAPTDAGPLHAA